MNISIIIISAIVLLLLIFTLIVLQFKNNLLRAKNKKSHKEIARQNELLEAVNQVSTILLEPDVSHLENSFVKSMNIMADAVGVDRVCIWKNYLKNEKLHCRLVYEWANDAGTIKNAAFTNDVPYGDPGWENILSSGRCINAVARDMSPDEYHMLSIKGIISIFVTPVFVNDKFWGYVGFDNCHSERVYTENEAIILRSAGRMIINAYIRNDMTQNLLNTTVQLESAVEEANEANRLKNISMTELIAAKEEAEQSSRYKSAFLANMSHEIRTPMNAILGIAEIQLQDKTLSPDSGEAFEKIFESGELLLNIINDILDLSKIEAGKLELVSVKYNIPSLLNDTAQLNCLRYESKPVSFSLYVDENTPYHLFGDELRIKQVLNNILSNAFKYTDEGKVDLSVSFEPESRDENVTIIFRISDTGQGMTEKQINKLFDEYTRFNLEANRTTIGAGLGMNITKRLVDLLNGKIDVESEPGKGSVFTVYIPQKRMDSEVCGRKLTDNLRNFRFKSSTITKKTQFLREYMPYGSVLVVDDVESNIYVTRGMLRPYGLKIDTANSGFEAIEKIKNGEIYDIVFMDHMMPKMDGIEAAKIMRNMGYKHYIVALTANALVGQSEMFLNNGFDGFMSKPIDSRELNLTLNDFIRNKKPPEVVQAARKEQYEKSLNDAGAYKENNTEDAEIKKIFVRDAENAVNAMKNIFTYKNESPDIANMNLFKITVHGIKSALANIGEKKLAEIAGKLEQAGKEGNIQFIIKETPAFTESLQSLIGIFKPKKENGGMEASEVDLEYLRERLIDIKTACSAIDKKKAKAALIDLKQKNWPEKINTVLEEIGVRLLHSEFDEAAASADKFITP